MPKHELLKIDTLSIIVRDSRIKAKSYHHKIRLKNIFYLSFFFNKSFIYSSYNHILSRARAVALATDVKTIVICRDSHIPCQVENCL